MKTIDELSDEEQMEHEQMMNFVSETSKEKPYKCDCKPLDMKFCEKCLAAGKFFAINRKCLRCGEGYTHNGGPCLWERNALNACATLKNPVEDIRELVLAARDCVDIPISEEDEFRLLRLEQSLSKFEGVK